MWVLIETVSVSTTETTAEFTIQVSTDSPTANLAVYYSDTNIVNENSLVAGVVSYRSIGNHRFEGVFRATGLTPNRVYNYLVVYKGLNDLRDEYRSNFRTDAPITPTIESVTVFTTQDSVRFSVIVANAGTTWNAHCLYGNGQTVGADGIYSLPGNRYECRFYQSGLTPATTYPYRVYVSYSSTIFDEEQGTFTTDSISPTAFQYTLTDSAEQRYINSIYGAFYQFTITSRDTHSYQVQVTYSINGANWVIGAYGSSDSGIIYGSQAGLSDGDTVRFQFNVLTDYNTGNPVSGRAGWYYTGEYDEKAVTISVTPIPPGGYDTPPYQPLMSSFVIAAICGCFASGWSEVNPGLWSSNTVVNWTDPYDPYSGVGAFGIFQFLNINGGTFQQQHLAHYKDWVDSYNYDPLEGDSQLDYFLPDASWYQSPNLIGSYTSLYDFVTTHETNLSTLVHDFNLAYVDSSGAYESQRLTWAQNIHDYIMLHKDDDLSLLSWVSRNGTLTTTEIYNNSMCFFRFFFLGDPTPERKKGFKWWMYIKYLLD